MTSGRPWVKTSDMLASAHPCSCTTYFPQPADAWNHNPAQKFRAAHVLHSLEVSDNTQALQQQDNEQQICVHTHLLAQPQKDLNWIKGRSLNVKIKSPSKYVSCCCSTTCVSCKNTNTVMDTACGWSYRSENWAHCERLSSLLTQAEITGFSDTNPSEAVKVKHKMLFNFNHHLMLHSESKRYGALLRDNLLEKSSL